MAKAKKPKPNPAADASTYPYVVKKKYWDDRYFRKWTEARAVILNDVLGIRDGFDLLKADDSVAACAALIKEINLMPANASATISGIVDPESGMKYQADLVRRDAL